jgi:PilZ domain
MGLSQTLRGFLSLAMRASGTDAIKTIFRSHRDASRIPLATMVRVDSYEASFNARSVHLGTGGMSLENTPRLLLSQPVQLTFALPSGPSITIAAVVRWKRKNLVGLRFDPRADTRPIKQWIEQQKPAV